MPVKKEVKAEAASVPVKRETTPTKTKPRDLTRALSSPTDIMKLYAGSAVKKEEMHTGVKKEVMQTEEQPPVSLLIERWGAN